MTVIIPFFRFGLTAVYLVAINYFTQIGGRISVRLIKKEKNRCSEYQANSLVYKVHALALVLNENNLLLSSSNLSK